MRTEQLIDDLELLAAKHKDDKYFTFETRWIDVLEAVINKLRELDWHTGIPTENGLYAVYYYADNEYDYGFATWNGKYWEEHFSFDDVGCRIIAWQKIEPYKEKEDAESSFYS